MDASEYVAEFRAVGESIAQTVTELLAEAQAAGQWPLAGIVAETGDQICHALANLTHHLEQAS